MRFERVERVINYRRVLIIMMRVEIELYIKERGGDKGQGGEEKIILYYIYVLFTLLPKVFNS